MLAAGASRRAGQAAETWTALLGAGDELAIGRITATLAGQPLTARKAYLLAFHQAQDAGDVEHMLAVADRLDAVGEADLASARPAGRGYPSGGDRRDSSRPAGSGVIGRR